MDLFGNSWWAPFLLILIGVSVPTGIWRVLGVLLSGRVNEGTEVLTWVRAVATALVAAVIAKLVLYPTGVLAEAPMLVRGGAVAAGFAAFMATRQSVLIGVVAGEAVFVFAVLLLEIYP